MPYDSAYALAQHLWKSSGSDYESYDSLDTALEAVFTVHADSKPIDGDALEEQSAEQSPNSTVADSAEQSPDPADAVADGGETGLGLGGKPTGADDRDGDDVDPQGDGDGEGDDPQCTECGSTEYFDASEVGFDFGCADCSDAEEWVVWSEEEA